MNTTRTPLLLGSCFLVELPDDIAVLDGGDAEGGGGKGEEE